MTATDGSVVAVDLGGTNLRAALVDADGRIVVARRVPTDRSDGPRSVIRQILDLTAELRDADTRAVGVAVPGAFDAADGVVLGIPALPGWNGIPLRRLVEDSSRVPCVLENDATAAAIGEWRVGAGRGCQHLVYVTISTGIGAGVVVDGRILRGVRGLAGEIGHTKIATTSEPCSCGNVGCWEAVASGTALGRRAAEHARQVPDGAIARLAAAPPTAGQPAADGMANATHVGAAARAGDAAALALLREEGRLLGEGFANAQHLYAPERIVMGGGLSSLLDLMREDIVAALRARLLPGFPPAEIQAAALGDDAGLIGVALQAAEAR